MQNDQKSEVFGVPRRRISKFGISTEVSEGHSVRPPKKKDPDQSTNGRLHITIGKTAALKQVYITSILSWHIS